MDCKELKKGLNFIIINIPGINSIVNHKPTYSLINEKIRYVDTITNAYLNMLLA